ncbi:MAG: hypothetical protein AABX98_03055, partial [Nanoarchaeota archaeon]
MNTTAPVILTISPDGFVSTPANVTVTTNEQANCRYSSTAINYSGMSNFGSTNGLTSHTVNLSAQFVQGLNVFYVACADNSAGDNAMLGSVIVDFVYDTERPAIAAVVPVNGSRVSNKTISFSLRDTVSGVNLTNISVAVNLNASNNTFSTASCGENGLGGYDCSFVAVNVSEGSNNFTVEARDNALNRLAHFVLFTYDSTVPTVTVNAPASGSVQNTKSLLLNISTDELGRCRYSRQNTVFGSMPDSMANISTQHLANVVSDEGSNTYYFACQDLALNEQASSTTFTVNTTAPVVTASGPFGVQGVLAVNLTVTTDAQATCRYDSSDRNFSQLATQFTNTGNVEHNSSVIPTRQG